MSTSPADQLQRAYYTVLNTNVSYGGSVVPVYDEVPRNATYPYIELGDYTEGDDSSKSDFGFECTFSVTIVDRYDGSFGSNIKIYDIWDSVKGLIRTRPQGLSLTGFSLISTTVDSSVKRSEKTDTHNYRILECRFRHQIRQL